MTILILYWHTGVLWRSQAVQGSHTFVALHKDKTAVIRFCASFAFGTMLMDQPDFGQIMDVVDNGNGTATARLLSPQLAS